MTYLVVGAGFTGATVAERLATVLGEKVLVIERRPYVGGSAADYRADDGLIIQRFGPHVFHTNSHKVWEYVQRFATWRPIKYKVGARVGDQIYRLPLDFDAVRQAHPFVVGREDLLRRLTERYGPFGSRIALPQLRKDFPALAEWAIEHVYRGYNEKFWGMPLEEVPASVLARLPFVVGEQESYFTDEHQAVPEDGYTATVARMLDHPKIKLVLNYDLARVEPAANTIWTGSPDAFFGEEGALPYRSVRFGQYAGAEMRQSKWRDGFATITLPTRDLEATRMTNMRILNADGAEHAPHEVWDFPEPYVPGSNDPFYPIPLDANIRRAQEYIARAPKRVWFAGRLGSYTYLNMDQAIAQGLALFERIKNG